MCSKKRYKMLDKKYNALEKEKKWQEYWFENDIYKFEPEGKKQYTIDTPPPTCNGKIHMGHLSSYMHIETIARHHRMKGEAVYFPFGFDDNGLPTERYVEKIIKKKAAELPRAKFVEICLDETRKLEEEFFDLYKTAGFSCNLKTHYSSIAPRTQKISQQSFIDLYNKGLVYHTESPTLWCTECHTAAAQSELESKDIESTFNYLKFYISGTDKYVVVATTRPEMLCGVVCVFINPKDEKNLHLLGKKLVVPYFNFEVPVLTDDLVDLEKGSGVVMCCTFGDTVDKEWQRKHNLEIKKCFTDEGTMTELAREFAGMTILDARKAVIEKLKENDLLIKQDVITHSVSTHDRCGTPVEIAVKKQWFIDVLSHKQELYDAGLKLNWYPSSMRARYLNWVENLSWNWCISRQRYFGIPFPVWYCKHCGKVKLADIKDLPVDPLKDLPKTACECGSTEFVPETDVMDTWATSSLTPQISTDLYTQKGFDDTMVPMNLRPNAHDNIRVWDFYTVTKSLYHFGKLPWKDLMISGYVTSSDGSKLAKSKGNSKSSPQEIIKEWSADVTRYWANNLTLGKDTAFSFVEFENGKKLVNKIWNASKFVLSFLENYTPKQVELQVMDQWILERYKELHKKFVMFLDKYEIALALNELEKFIWNFCDNYIEIVKRRLYNPDIYGEAECESAKYACYYVLLGMLKMFAPILPHITEEIFMDYYAQKENAKSIHTSGYLDLGQDINNEIIENGNKLVDIVSQIRQFKSENKVSLRAEIESVSITSNISKFLQMAEVDIKNVCSIHNLNLFDGEYKLDIGKILEKIE